jgi:hypothetical protein
VLECMPVQPKQVASMKYNEIEDKRNLQPQDSASRIEAICWYALGQVQDPVHRYCQVGIEALERWGMSPAMGDPKYIAEYLRWMEPNGSRPKLSEMMG